MAGVASATIANDDPDEYRSSSTLLFYTANRCSGKCHYSIPLRYGIACKHYLRRFCTQNLSITESILFGGFGGREFTSLAGSPVILRRYHIARGVELQCE
jgi:hypothetical protein